MDKFIFLDRDGTIIKDTGYIYKVSDLEFLPGAIDGLKNFKKLGYKFIIVSNQAGIARGLYTQKDAENFSQELVLRLSRKNIAIERIYMCPHHPKFTGPCSCRKPNIGMAELASKELNIDLKRSIFIGDKNSDIDLGKNCGGLTIWIKNNQYPNNSSPDFSVENLNHAFKLLHPSEYLNNTS